MAEDCIFCGIVAGELPAQIIDPDERTVAFLDINPAARLHISYTFCLLMRPG